MENKYFWSASNSLSVNEKIHIDPFNELKKNIAQQCEEV